MEMLSIDSGGCFECVLFVAGHWKHMDFTLN